MMGGVLRKAGSWALLITGAKVAAFSLAVAQEGRLTEPGEVVKRFLTEVRSGRNPEAARAFMAPLVVAHQVTSEGEVAIVRTPEEYADHVREFQEAFGDFELTIEEFLVDGQKVFVRWKQVGHHQKSLSGEKPTSMQLVELTSVVYRVEQNHIVEYWLQTDRMGLELQLRRAVNLSPATRDTPMREASQH